MHYYCKGDCGGVADEAGVCKTEDCNMKGKDLAVCGCGDSQNHVDSEENSMPKEEDEG